MQENLFSKVNIDLNNTHMPNGEATNPEEECKSYERKISASGGIDIQVLGIGQNGHIGFNEPDKVLISGTHLTKLTESTIDANSRFFKSRAEVPTSALTMGLSTILSAKKIVLLASGTSKKKAVAALLNDKIDTEIPATMLKMHPDVTLICDREAYSGISLGVDIGGTDIKFGIIENGKVLAKYKIPTLHKEDTGAFVKYVADECKKLIEEYGVAKVGVGVPGCVLNGVVVEAGNLNFKNVPLARMLSEELNMKVKIQNDANCAALGEAVYGEGEKFKNEIMITIGTGIGGGIIINNKIYNGRGDAGEIGHMIIEKDGRECPCGQKGCFEQYASATALSKDAENAALSDKDSVLYKMYEENDCKMNGKLFFEALKKGCKTAEAVFENYTDYFADGIKSVIMIFSPDVIVLSGGITREGNLLLDPIVKKVGMDVPVKISSLQSDAGIMGAALV